MSVLSEDGKSCEKEFWSFLHYMESFIGQKWCKQTNELCKQTYDYSDHRKEQRMNETKRRKNLQQLSNEKHLVV